MPEYFPKDIDGYHIDITPRGRFRSILRFFHKEPWYVVGNKINLTFTFTKIKTDTKPIGVVANLISYYPQKERDNPTYISTPIRILVDVPNKIYYTSPFAITKEGTIEIYIVNKIFEDSQENILINRIELFSASAIHKDISNHDTFLVMIGILGGGFLGCLASIVAPLILSHFTGISKPWIQIKIREQKR